MRRHGRLLSNGPEVGHAHRVDDGAPCPASTALIPRGMQASAEASKLGKELQKERLQRQRLEDKVGRVKYCSLCASQ